MPDMGIQMDGAVSEDGISEAEINLKIVLFILAITFLIYGFDILKSGFKNLIHKTPNMDTLVGIGVISSFLYSLYKLL